MIREATIILPLLDNEGHDLREAHYNLKRRLLQAFEGYTKDETSGGWIGPSGHLYEEHAARYTVAFEENDRIAHASFRTIADMARMEGRQIALYVRFPNGEVLFVTGGQEQYSPERDAA